MNIPKVRGFIFKKYNANATNRYANAANTNYANDFLFA